MSPTAATVNRQPKNAPNSVGGQFGSLDRPEGPSLGNGRTTFTGYELRKYRVLGHGAAGEAWTATIYREGAKAVVVTDDGNGDGPQFIALGDSMDRSAKEMAAFRFLSTDLFGNTKEAAGKFAATLKLSADIDQHAAEEGISRPEAVWDYVQAEEIEAGEAKLYINGYVD